MARASEKQLGRWSARAKETKSLVAKWARTMEMALEKTMGLRLALMQDRGYMGSELVDLVPDATTNNALRQLRSLYGDLDDRFNPEFVKIA